MVCLKNLSKIDRAQLRMHAVIGELYMEQEMSPTFATMNLSYV
jgi:hypothetical protein